MNPDVTFEDSLIEEIRRLEAENAELKATIRMVAKVLGLTVENLGTVR